MIKNEAQHSPKLKKCQVPLSKEKDKRSYYQRELWNVSQQQAYAWMSEFIKFIISSTISKAKLWTGWTYDTTGIKSFDSLHAWLSKRIGLLTVKW